MSLIALAVFPAGIGVLLWLVNPYGSIPMSGKVKKIRDVFVIICALCSCVPVMIVVGMLLWLVNSYISLEDACRIKAGQIFAALKTSLQPAVKSREYSFGMKSSGTR